MSNLAKLTAAERALAKATTLPAVQKIRAQAAGMAEFAKKAKDRRALGLAAEVLRRAERRLGEILEGMRKAGTRAKVGKPKKGSPGTHIKTLSDQGVHKKLADRARKFAAMPEGKFEASVARTVRLALALLEGERAALASAREEQHREKKAKRQARERELAGKVLALPTKKYGVILADPEWKFEFYNQETGADASAENHFSVSELEAIKQRDVASIAADDSALFLWATVPMLPQALEVMAAWGFKYVSNIAWDKVRPGQGYWVRNQHELLLIGRRGKIPAPAQGEQPASVIRELKRKHSQKPEASYRMIEKMFPTLPRVELNARSRRRGWDAWGFEAPAE